MRMIKSLLTRYVNFVLLYFQTVVRHYSVKPPMTIEQIKKRVLLVLQLYDKVNPDKVYTVLWQQLGI